MSLVIKLCSEPFEDTYLVEYDPTREGVAPDGRELIAYIAVTTDKAKAKVFPSIVEAFECWRQEYGVRIIDGKPNRPLTAFTITFENV